MDSAKAEGVTKRSGRSSLPIPSDAKKSPRQFGLLSRTRIAAKSPLVDGEFSEDYEATEGRILTVQHRKRERDRKIVQQKKTKVLEEKGRLVCEACAFDFEELYRKRGAGFIDATTRSPSMLWSQARRRS